MSSAQLGHPVVFERFFRRRFCEVDPAEAGHDLIEETDGRSGSSRKESLPHGAPKLHSVTIFERWHRGINLRRTWAKFRSLPTLGDVNASPMFLGTEFFHFQENKHLNRIFQIWTSCANILQINGCSMGFQWFFHVFFQLFHRRLSQVPGDSGHGGPHPSRFVEEPVPWGRTFN